MHTDTKKTPQFGGGANYEIIFKSSKFKWGDGSVLLKNATVKEVAYGKNGFVKTKYVSITKFAKKLTSAIALYNDDKAIDPMLARQGAPTIIWADAPPAKQGAPTIIPFIRPFIREKVMSSVLAKKNALLVKGDPIPLSLLKSGKFVVKVGAPAGLTPAAAELGFLVDGSYDYAVQGPNEVATKNEVATITSVKNSAGKTLHKVVKVTTPLVFNAESPTYNKSTFTVNNEFISTDSRSDDAFIGEWELVKSLLTCSTKGYDLLQKKYVSVKTEIAKIPTGYNIDSYSNNIKIQSAMLTRILPHVAGRPP